MKILVVMMYWYPYEGPLMPIYSALFKRLLQKGYSITIVTSFPHYRKGRLETWQEYRGKLYEVTGREGVKLIRSYVFAPIFKQNKFGLVCRALNFISFNISSLLAAVFLAGEADIVFAPSSPPLTNGVISWIVGKIKRCPMVYNVQDLYPDMAVKMGVIKKGALLKILECVEHFVYQHSKKILTISDGMTDIISQKGVPDSKLETVENFIHTDFITPLSQENDFSRNHGLAGKFIVMYAGNIGIPHGVEVLVETAELLRNDGEIIFCFVARGEHKSSVQALAKQKKLKNVLFVEPQPQEIVPLIWAAASVGMITYRKGLSDFSVPSKLLAMMCAARPVIAAVDEGSDSAQIIRTSGCGFVVQPESPNFIAEKIIKLKNDAQVSQNMGTTGRKYVEKNLTLKMITSKYEKVFNEIIK